MAKMTFLKAANGIVLLCFIVSLLRFKTATAATSDKWEEIASVQLTICLRSSEYLHSHSGQAGRDLMEPL